MKTDFKPHLRQTECWSVLERVLNEELQSLRVSNDNEYDDRETQLLRGKIKGIKFVLSLGKEQHLLGQEDPLF